MSKFLRFVYALTLTMIWGKNAMAKAICRRFRLSILAGANEYMLWASWKFAWNNRIASLLASRQTMKVYVEKCRHIRMMILKRRAWSLHLTALNDSCIGCIVYAKVRSKTRKLFQRNCCHSIHWHSPIAQSIPPFSQTETISIPTYIISGLGLSYLSRMLFCYIEKREKENRRSIVCESCALCARQLLACIFSFATHLFHVNE